MSEHGVQRPRHLREIERIHQQARVPDLSVSQPASKLLLDGFPLLRGLLLEGAKRPELSLDCGDLLDDGGAEASDQLVLEVRDADVEAEPFHIDASEARAQADPLEAALEVGLLGSVAETGESDIQSVRPEAVQEAPDGLRTAHWHDGDALFAEIPAAALSQRLEGALVADPFDEHDRAPDEGLTHS